MKEYHKIQSVLKRDERSHKFIVGEFSLPEFEFLRNCEWEWSEKIDGTNIRIGWDGEKVSFGGRTDNAQIPTFLYAKLAEIFTAGRFAGQPPMTLYGEGFGARIQKGGGNYIPNGCDFALFDVLVDTWWLRREDVADVAAKLGIRTVPDLMRCSLLDAISHTRVGFVSSFGGFQAEGLVGRPMVELFARNGDRIITKMKSKDF